MNGSPSGYHLTMFSSFMKSLPRQGMRAGKKISYLSLAHFRIRMKFDDSLTLNINFRFFITCIRGLIMMRSIAKKYSFKEHFPNHPLHFGHCCFKRHSFFSYSCLMRLSVEKSIDFPSCFRFGATKIWNYSFSSKKLPVSQLEIF